MKYIPHIPPMKFHVPLFDIAAALTTFQQQAPKV
jgi:hypothetical protein